MYQYLDIAVFQILLVGPLWFLNINTNLTLEYHHYSLQDYGKLNCYQSPQLHWPVYSLGAFLRKEYSSFSSLAMCSGLQLHFLICWQRSQSINASVHTCGIHNNIYCIVLIFFLVSSIVCAIKVHAISCCDLAQHCITIFWITDASMQQGIAWIQKYMKIFLVCWTKGGHMDLPVGSFFFTNILCFFLRLVKFWSGLNWREVNSASTHSHSWVFTDNHCSMRWSSVLIMAFL